MKVTLLVFYHACAILFFCMALHPAAFGANPGQEDGLELFSYEEYKHVMLAGSPHWKTMHKHIEAVRPDWRGCLTFAYPQHLGSPAVDKAIRKLANEIFATFIEDFSALEEALAPLELARENCSYAYKTVNYAATAPSEKYLTVIFECIEQGGTLRSWWYKTATFDTATGRQLGLKDFFPNPEQSLPAYKFFFLNALQKQRSLSSCFAADDDMEFMPEFFALAADGLYVFYGSGSFPNCRGGMGSPGMIRIPKQDFIRMGGNPVLYP